MRRAALTVAAVACLVPAAAHGAPLDELLASCKTRASRDKVAHRICTAPVASFDGTPLDTTLTLPVRTPRRGRPLIVFLHGFLADKGEYLSETAGGTGSDRGGNAYKTVEWNNVWFARRGYAVLNYSARGQGASGGQVGLASKHLEVRDTHHLTGLLADDRRLRIRPRRVAVLGSSYGGGQAWLLLTTRGDGVRQYGSWRSPGGRLVRLAAVVPQFTWTNLLQALLPNGRDEDTPLGIGKLSIVDGLTASANTKLSPETLSWTARLNAGEPYDDPSDPIIPAAKRALSVDRSAAYQDGYFQALAGGGQRAVPVLAAQGWTDPIFPVREAVWMYRRLRAARRDYPIRLYLGDFEHLTAAVKVPEFRYFHRLGNRLLDRYLRGLKTRRVRFDVRSAPTRCDPRAFGPVLRARRFGALAPDRLTLELGGPRFLQSPLTDPRGPATDPVAASMASGRGCVTTDVPTSAGVGVYDYPAFEQPFTLIGTPLLRLYYRTSAPDVQLNSRLWDIAPDGTERLVTRGAYRAVRPDPGGAVAEYPMFGNHWRFEAGHRLRLEVTNIDAPFLRADNFPAVTTVDDARLELPGRD